VACLAVLLLVCFFAWRWPAELGAPADAADAYDAARPEWYFLFLFQFLKLFHGEMGEFLGAIVVPGALMGILFLMPILGHTRIGHRFNIAFLFLVLLGAGVLTGLAWWEDRQSRYLPFDTFAEIAAAQENIAADVRRNGSASPYASAGDEEKQLVLYYK